MLRRITMLLNFLSTACNSNDFKKTWRVIHSIIGTGEVNKRIDHLCINGATIDDADIIDEKLNNYFTETAASLVEKIPHSTNSYYKCLKQSPLKFLMVSPTSPKEMLSWNKTIKSSHSSGIDDIDPVIANPNLH